ncbi:MAG: tRNA lysidine(34) synthetase TilS [Bacteroidia bacterium]|nr:tRNA lysidine(34) synthetase TilS [Bacteroidia bacterium]
MLNRFKKFISDKNLFTPEHRLLLAVSGGVDSVVLAYLCYRAGFNFSIAHCNFGLRGEESEGDEKFIEQLAGKFNVQFHTKRFDTQAFAGKRNVSVQMAARELRYNWFAAVCHQEKYDRVVIAHHKDDEIETLFINIIRGTGISGLHGIPLQRDNIVRPLLFATRVDIENYAKNNKLLFREDSSNSSDKYIRNKLRHKVIPVLKEINPNLEAAISRDIEHFQQVEKIYKEAIGRKLAKLIVKRKNGIEADVRKLLRLNPAPVYLYELLSPYGFNDTVCNDVLKAMIDDRTGRRFFSATHRLVKDRLRLIITSNTVSGEEEYLIRSGMKKLTEPLSLTVSKSKAVSYSIPRSNRVASLDFDKLKFPLTIRKWRKGDAFRPLGMKHKKKLSDFFIDNKFSLIDKEHTWLLTSGTDIVWVIGYRLDDRFKVTDKTKNVYVISV